MRFRQWLVCCAAATALSGVACGTDSDDAPQLWDTYDQSFLGHLEAANDTVGRAVVSWSEIAPGLVPRHVRMEGSHFDLGYWTGLVARDAGHTPRSRSAADAEMNGRIETMYETVSPGYLELVSGVCAAYGMTLDQVDLRHFEHGFFNGLWWELFKYSRFLELGFDGTDGNRGRNCSLVSARVEPGGAPWVGRNFDNPSDRPHFVAASRIDGAHSIVGNTCYTLYHWMTDGVNEHGLFLGVATNAFPPEYNQAEPSYPDEPAVQVIHMVRIALETCTTTEEVIRLFGSVRIWFPVEVNHILVADANGSAAVLEFDLNRQLIVFGVGAPHLVVTNVAHQEGEQQMRDSCWRYRQATDTLSQGELNHDTFLRAVDSIRVLQGGSRTLWTAYFDLQNRQMEARFRSDLFDVGYPFSLP